MKLSVQREILIKPLQAIIGVVEKRHTMAILSNILLQTSKGVLKITATDLEIELVASLTVDEIEEGSITIPGRKLVDICRALPEHSVIEIIKESSNKVVVKSGKNRFVLAGLPQNEFPTIDSQTGQEALQVSQQGLSDLIRNTYFSMAQQDVRYFLNGMLLEIKPGSLRAVATDGHRLATSEMALEGSVTEEKQVIVPRKGVLELMRLLDDSDEKVSLFLSQHHIRVVLPNLTFTSKLVDGRYPDYHRVIPARGQNVLTVDRDHLKQALNLVAILSNEKYRAVRLRFEEKSLALAANNPEQEQAENEIEVHYQGTPLEIGFNVNYLIEILSVLPAGEIEISLANASSSALVHQKGVQNNLYVVMPIRL